MSNKHIVAAFAGSIVKISGGHKENDQSMIEGYDSLIFKCRNALIKVQTNR